MQPNQTVPSVNYTFLLVRSKHVNTQRGYLEQTWQEQHGGQEGAEPWRKGKEGDPQYL